MMEVIMSTVAGLVPNDERANSVIASLGATGIAENQVVVLRQPADVWQRLDGHHKLRAVFRSALIGLLIGIVIGLCYGIPTGILNCRFMNCSIGNSLILLSLVTLYWAAGGAFLGAIVLPGVELQGQKGCAWTEPSRALPLLLCRGRAPW
jgi:hypothetical protein